MVLFSPGLFAVFARARLRGIWEVEEDYGIRIAIGRALEAVNFH